MKDKNNIQQFSPFDERVMPVVAIGISFKEDDPSEMIVDLKFSEPGTKMISEIGNGEIGKLICAVGKKMIEEEYDRSRRSFILKNGEDV